MRAVSRSLAQAHRPPDIRDGRSDRRTPVGSASQMPNVERTLPVQWHGPQTAVRSAIAKQ